MATTTPQKHDDLSKKAQDAAAPLANQARNAAENMGDKAKGMLDNATDKARDLAGNAADKARDLAGNVADRARDAASSVGHGATHATSSVGHTMENLAGTLREKAPHQGVLGSAASTVAGGLETSGRYLQEEGLQGMADDLTSLIRRNPFPAILVGIALGYVIARATSRS